MPICLIQEAEKLSYKMPPSVIWYRRIPAIKRNLVIKKYTRKGAVDWSSVAAELLEWAIYGWDGVTDGEEEIKFDPALIARLPEDVRGDLMTLCGAAEGDQGEETGGGNS